jgi:hypothetical protein
MVKHGPNYESSYPSKRAKVSHEELAPLESPQTKPKEVFFEITQVSSQTTYHIRYDRIECVQVESRTSTYTAPKSSHHMKIMMENRIITIDGTESEIKAIRDLILENTDL